VHVPWIDPEHEIADIRSWFERRGRELWVQPSPDGQWRAVVTESGRQTGEAHYADGASEVEAARRARRSYAGKQLRDALSTVGAIAQSEAGQLVITELALARVPMLKRPAARRALLAGSIWMADPRNRGAVKELGRRAGDWAVLQARETPSGNRRQLGGSQTQAVAKLAAEQGLRELRRLTRGS
jgi:hypothetical protein